MLVEKERVNYWINPVGQKESIFLIYGRFKRIALSEGWTEREVDVVISKCMQLEYDEAVALLRHHCQH